MNTDDFEKQLQRQPMRRLPDQWRDSILSACRDRIASADPSIVHHPSSSSDSWWRKLFWPCPQAWVGLAAVWVVTLVLQLMAASEPPRSISPNVTAASSDLRLALAEQRRL